MMDTECRARPGDALLHPIALAAIATLLLNDHVLKARFPGFVTGKLSDIAGLVFFPLLLAAAVEALSRAAGLVAADAPALSRRRVIAGCAAATALAFAAVKTWEPATAACEAAFGVAQWPLRAGWALARGALPGMPVPARITCDPTDLVALPFAGVCLLLARDRIRVQG
jgi:hypothetical protein